MTREVALRSRRRDISLPEHHRAMYALLLEVTWMNTDAKRLRFIFEARNESVISQNVQTVPF